MIQPLIQPRKPSDNPGYLTNKPRHFIHTVIYNLSTSRATCRVARKHNTETIITCIHVKAPHQRIHTRVLILLRVFYVYDTHAPLLLLPIPKRPWFFIDFDRHMLRSVWLS